ncbi:MAG: hypothetical protein AAB588_04280 [Patescibacteria group bacterium]
MKLRGASKLFIGFVMMLAASVVFLAPLGQAADSTSKTETARFSYKLDLVKVAVEKRADSARKVREVIKKRLKKLGYLTAKVSLTVNRKEQRLRVEIPEKLEYPDEIRELLARSLVLEFKVKDLKKSSSMKTVWKTTPLQNIYVAKTNISPGMFGDPNVLIQFTKKGGQIFQKMTAENIGQPIAIFLDGELISSPTVNAEITDGQAIIVGAFNLYEAKKLMRDIGMPPLPVSTRLIPES